MVSRKVVHQMGNSFSWKTYMFGLLCGICLTSLLLSVITLFGAFQLGDISVSTFSIGIVAKDPRSKDATVAGLRSIAKENVRSNDLQEDTIPEINEQMQLLYYDWSNLLNKSINSGGDFPGSSTLGGPSPLRAPHLEDCRMRSELNRRLDTRVQSERFHAWTIWKGTLDEFPLSAINGQQETYLRRPLASEGLYPPWITGSDEENYPLTRKAQSDIWLHQHPLNCSHPETKFLFADWERLPRLGIGAQIVAMSSLLSMAIFEKRVLVTGYYNRADHDGCKGSSRSSWSCYFFQETSQECRERAFELMKSKDAWDTGIITGKDNYTSTIWKARAPSVWGKPWRYMQPTTDINRSLIASHHRMDRRWWRAQAVRYLMRFQTEYTCNLLNVARHEAFGWEAAKLVLASPSANLAENGAKGSDIEKYVWSNHQPWMPRPLLSMHVRMGDKASEMKVAGFEEYMNLAERIRKHFPHLNRIWLSTEMQEVIDGTKLYPHWEFYYTKVSRQVGNTKMANYEASLGRETSTNTAMVNFLMASKADFFIGALGSTWCFLIDGMRNTGGKVMSGYLSVNKDRFW